MMKVTSSQTPIIDAGIQKNAHPRQNEEQQQINARMPLPTSSRTQEVNKDEIAYPGISAHFELVDGNWHLYTFGSDLVRYLTFKSMTPYSLLTEVSLLGYGDGSVALLISFDSKNKDKITDYLTQNDFALSSGDKINIDCGHYKTYDKEHLKKLFEILKKFNTFDKRLFLMSNVVWRGEWKPIVKVEVVEGGQFWQLRTFL